MTTETIETVLRKHQGKLVDKWSSYLPVYERVLPPRDTTDLCLLEIGVQNGGSAELWGQWFGAARAIVGCDIDPRCASLRFEDSRIHLIVADANTDVAEEQIAAIAPRYDVIIDDGSHRSSDIVRSFARYFPRLKDGGVFIIEDLHCSYRQSFEGGLYDPVSSMAFLKRLADVVNHEHWGIQAARASVVEACLKQYGVQLDEAVLAQIHSVEFWNSLCVVNKAPAEANVLGRRAVYGTSAAVEERIAAWGGTAAEHEDQSANPWSSLSPEAELAERAGEMEKLKASLATLTAEVDARKTQLDIQAQELAEYKQQYEAETQRMAEERAKFRSTLSERDRQVLSTGATIRDLSIHLAERNQELRHATQRLHDVEHKVASLKGRVERLQKSVSWRITKPIRVATRPLRQPAMLLPKSDSLAGRGVARIVSLVEPPGGFDRARRRVRKVIREKGLLGAASRLMELASGRAGLAPYQPKGGAGRPHWHRPASESDYTEWLRKYDDLSPAKRAGLTARAARFAKQPVISVLMPAYNPDPQFLSEAIDSVRAQVYPHWELCIADDASTDPRVRPVLEAYAALDPRIKVCFRSENGHISAASNSALELVTGEWTALLDHDDKLPEHALFWVAEAINRVDGVRMIYSDEDKITENGERIHPYFKCDWNEDLFRSHNMFSHLGVFETALLRDIGGFRRGFEGSQDYDVVWRCLERVPRTAIVHIPRVLYSWRMHSQSTAMSIDSKPYAVTAGERAMLEHFERTGINATVESVLGGYRVRYAVPSPEPLVSIVIPTRNGLDLVTRCVRSIFELTTYRNFEIVLVDNGSDDPAALAYFKRLAERSDVTLVRDERPFNFSALNNVGVQAARGEYVCLLNNDIEVITPEWLSELLSIAVQPGVGAVGARLWYPDDTLQHAGVILSPEHVALHAHKGFPRGQYGYFGRAILRQSYSCLTAACLLIRKSTYLQVGGMNEPELAVGFNDVDFCLKVKSAGYRNVWTPYADLYHYESASRGNDTGPEQRARLQRELAYMRAKWGHIIQNDPAYSPNLTQSWEDFSYAWPPRLSD